VVVVLKTPPKHRGVAAAAGSAQQSRVPLLHHTRVSSCTPKKMWCLLAPFLLSLFDLVCAQFAQIFNFFWRFVTIFKLFNG